MMVQFGLRGRVVSLLVGVLLALGVGSCQKTDRTEERAEGGVTPAAARAGARERVADRSSDRAAEGVDASSARVRDRGAGAADAGGAGAGPTPPSGALVEAPELVVPVPALRPSSEAGAAARDVAAATRDGGEWVCYFGNLHAHSAVSDGVLTPMEAYTYARDVGRLNFICLSEHNHMTTTAELSQVRAAAEAATTTNFVALVGQEYSTIANGNHVNVFDMTDAIPIGLNTNYREVYTRVIPDYRAANAERVVFCQFNHPNRVRDDYGIAASPVFANYNGDFAAFRRDADPLVSLIAVISGPADSNAPKTGWTPPVDAHRDAESKFLSAWKEYLEKGFHLSPSADQDNHRRSWGTRTTARTGVWVQGEFNRRSLLEALRDGRTFATEDKNLKVLLTVNGAAMGSQLRDDGTAELAIRVTVSDGDEPNSRYFMRLFREVIGDGQVSTDPLVRSDTIANGGSHTFVVTHEGGVNECYYAEVVQEGSRDNAWTAPVWIERSVLDESPGHNEEVPDVGARFVGSRRSNVYHLPHCKHVKRILAENLVTYQDAPAGKRLHIGCPVEEE